jgi:hypothetical protein
MGENKLHTTTGKHKLNDLINDEYNLDKVNICCEKVGFWRRDQITKSASHTG